MKRVGEIPEQTQARISDGQWAELCDGSVWELDMSDVARFGYKNMDSMRGSVAHRGRTAGPRVRVSIDRVGGFLYVQAQ